MHNLTEEYKGDYSDLNNTTDGGQEQNTSFKGNKYSKQNQRSQSVLKSHTEFNHNF